MMEVWELKDDGDPITVAHNEIRRLRGEVERLRAERDDWKDTANDTAKICTLKDAEVERLRVENDKMAYQLASIAAFVVHPYSAAKAVLQELGRWKEPSEK
jgi:hypothetical protein